MILRVFAAALLLLPPAALAQGNPGPFGGLFGRTPERTGRDVTIFELRGSGTLQRDDALLAEGRPENDQLEAGDIGALVGSLAFQRDSDRIQFRLRSAASYQQYFREPKFGGTTVDTSAVFSGQVATRLMIDASLNHVYSPFFQLQPTPLVAAPPRAGVLVPVSPFVVSLLENHTGQATVGFTSRYARRSTLSGLVSRRETRFLQQPHHDFTVDGLRAQWSRNLNRDLIFRAGYNREEVHQVANAGVEFVHESIDLGVDFARGLSLGRRTQLAFTTQTSMIKRPGIGRQYRLNGSAALTRGFRRTWYAGLSASRTTEFMPGFLEPLFSDTAGLSLGGMFAPRVEWLAMVNGGRGEFGVDGAGGRFTSANATTQLNVALSRRWGVFGQYAFFHYELPPGAAAVDLVSRLSRQTITVGLTTWVPILIRERTPRDPR